MAERLQARKLAKDTFRDSLPVNVTKLHAAVVAKYGPDTPEVLECFPQGRKVFSNSTDDHLENHLQTLHDALVTHQADLGASVINDAAGLLSTWIALYAASELSTGAKTTTEAGTRAARVALQLELFKNLLTIALNFPGQPETLPLYMEQHFLEDRPAEEEEEPEPPPPGP